MKTKLRIITNEHPLYMGMFTDEGNIQASNMVNIIIYEAVQAEFERHELQDVLNRDMHILSQSGYYEIFDTDVRSKIAARLNHELLIPLKWQQIDYFFEDVE
jgi:hypothetical protein